MSDDAAWQAILGAKNEHITSLKEEVAYLRERLQEATNPGVLYWQPSGQVDFPAPGRVWNPGSGAKQTAGYAAMAHAAEGLGERAKWGGTD